MTACPTLLIQGLTDSFWPDQADANARAIAATAPLAVRWTDGDYDARSATQAQDDAAAEAWLGHYVQGRDQTGLEGSPAGRRLHPCAPPGAGRAHRPGDAPAYLGLGEDDATWSTILPVAAKGLELHSPAWHNRVDDQYPGLAAAGLSPPTYQLAAMPAVGST